MPLPKSPTIWLRESSPVLRPRISTTACDHGAGQDWNRAVSLGVAPQPGKPAPMPGRICAIVLEKKIPRNFNQTKLRGPLESTKRTKKEAKTKLSEAENPPESREAVAGRSSVPNTHHISCLEASKGLEIAASRSRRACVDLSSRPRMSAGGSRAGCPSWKTGSRRLPC